jgi:hypothetical protein
MIPGSQFDLSVPGHNVNVVMTSVGNTLPLPVGGQVTIEVFTGQGAMPASAPGYQGLAVLGDHRIDLIGGSFAVQDTGADHDTIVAHGDYETITGGTGSSLFVARGDFDLIQTHGDATVNVFGAYDTVEAGTGNLHIEVHGNSGQVIGGSGNDTIEVFGDGATIYAGTHDLIQLLGKGTTIVDTPQVYHDTVVGFTEGSDHVQLTTDTPAHAVSSQQVNNGKDTLITLADGSTILFKGVNHIDSGFFA